MAKVIATDRLNRDYQPEQLIKVSISNTIATLIANSLNYRDSELFYKVVEDDYVLDLQSMYDAVNKEAPDSFYVKQYGLKALSTLNGVAIFLDEM